MNIVLQHWDGELNDLAKASIKNINQYATQIGAEYELVTGKPFREHLTPPCQKVCCISEKYDKYDNVLMLDPDVFIVKGLERNIFEEEGNGIHGPTQALLKTRLIQKNKITEVAPYWAGSIYKFSKEERIKLREQIPTTDEWMNEFNKAYHFEDEGILSQLAFKAALPIKYLDFKWNQCSFLPEPEKAYMLHIRTKLPGQIHGTWKNGGKQDKLLNYNALVDQRII
tara:strand:- start:1405 stop:2082 length:678 start_codon:yes stop_codon:yes gene_type:complete